MIALVEIHDVCHVSLSRVIHRPARHPGYRNDPVSRLVEGEPAVAVLAGALARVAALVPYLTAEIEPDGWAAPGGPTAPERLVAAEGEWMSCGALIDDPPWLGRIISSTGTGFGTDDPVVAASVFRPGLLLRVLTLTVACLTASASSPTHRPPPWPSGWCGTGPRSWPSPGPP